jgi:hypothetical protein
MLSSCGPLGAALAGVGGSAAVSHTMGGIAYRTFTAPVEKVRQASMTALAKMGVEFTGTGKDTDGAELINARTTDRDITITLESLSPRATRMKVIARNGGIFFDGATATEILQQTERSLGRA